MKMLLALVASIVMTLAMQFSWVVLASWVFFDDPWAVFKFFIR